MGFIYKITSSHDKRVYVGKSKTTSDIRFDKHKKDYKGWCKGKQINYITSFELMKYDDCIMIVLENDISDDMLSQREGYWYTQFDCVNSQVPNRTLKEWYQDNRDKMLEYKRQYRINNQDEILEYNKQYYQNNQEKIANYNSQKITCECGCISSRGKITRHKRSKKHKQIMDNQTLILS